MPPFRLEFVSTINLIASRLRSKIAIHGKRSKNGCDAEICKIARWLRVTVGWPPDESPQRLSSGPSLVFLSALSIVFASLREPKSSQNGFLAKTQRGSKGAKPDQDIASA